MKNNNVISLIKHLLFAGQRSDRKKFGEFFYPTGSQYFSTWKFASRVRSSCKSLKTKTKVEDVTDLNL